MNVLLGIDILCAELKECFDTNEYSVLYSNREAAERCSDQKQPDNEALQKIADCYLDDFDISKLKLSLLFSIKKICEK